MGKYYDPNKDYSAEIAKTTDSKKREKLLRERQNKINDMGLSGKVASNDVVSSWTSNYQPGGWNGNLNNGRGGFNPVDRSSDININDLYTALERKKLKKYDKARRNNERRLENRLKGINSDYDELNRQTEINAKRTALANAEKLAVLGLSGNAYETPTSGYSESTRIATDNAMRQAIADNERAKSAAKNAITDAIINNNSEIDLAEADAIANLTLKEIDSFLELRKQDNDYKLRSASFTGYLDGVPTMDRISIENEQNKQEFIENQQAYENAFNRWKIYGVVLPGDAEILGVPAGTKTQSYLFDEAKRNLDYMKAIR